MLSNAGAAATIAVRDLDAAKQYYTETLGLKIADDISPAAIFFEAGGGSRVLVYPRPNHEPSAATIATFEVSDTAETVATLKSKGVTFEDYDFPGLKTENGIATLPSGTKAAWFTDPDGNIISIVDR